MLSAFGLKCTPESDYVTRTHLNAKNSDGTLIITQDVESAGTRCTLNGCLKHSKVSHVIRLDNSMSDEIYESWVDSTVDFIVTNEIRTLNVAGNRDLADETLIHDFTVMFLTEVFSRLDDNNLLIRDTDL